MKVRHRKELKNGKRHVLVELDANETLIAFDADAYYKMGYPQEEVVQGYIILDSVHVTWCVIGQEWISNE